MIWIGKPLSWKFRARTVGNAIRAKWRKSSLGIDEGEASERIASIVERYEDLIDGYTPRLTRAEWLLMVGKDTDKWGLATEECHRILHRLRLSAAEGMALVERIERYRRVRHLPIDEALSAAGIEPVEPS